jgi:hypothetical protein
LTSVSLLVVVLVLESESEKLPVMELPLCCVVSLAAAVEPPAMVKVWFVSREVVISLELSLWLEELKPVMSLPLSVEAALSLPLVVVLLVSVWFTSVSQLVVVVELESDNEKLPVTSLRLSWLLSVPVVVELAVTVKTGWKPAPPVLVSVLLVLSLELPAALVLSAPVASLPVALELVQPLAMSSELVLSVWFVSVSQVVAVVWSDSLSE